MPHLFAAFGIITINYLQHDGCDTDHAFNHSRNFTGRLVNWICFNNGFHGIHHMHPAMHWSLTPAAHAEELAPYIHPNLDQPNLLVYGAGGYRYADYVRVGLPLNVLLMLTTVGLLPLIWGLLLARHLPLGMAEAGALLPVSLAPLGAGADGTWLAALPAWRADAHVVAFCQSAAVLVGCATSVVVLRRLLANSRIAWLGSSALALALAAGGRWLVAFP